MIYTASVSCRAASLWENGWKASSSGWSRQVVITQSEVICQGIRLVEEREKKLLELDATLARGIADADPGRTHPADGVFAELRARYKGMIEGRDE